MAKKKKHSSHQDQDDLKKYLKGETSPKEEHIIEKKTLEDPFLKDALEGLESHNPEDIIYDLDQLDRQIDRSTTTTKTSTWLYRSAAAILVLAIASSIIYFLAARVDTISNLDTISLKQDKIDEEQAEKTFKAVPQKSDSGEIPQLAKNEIQEEAKESLKSAEIQKEVVDNYQEADIADPARGEIQSLDEEKIKRKTLDLAPTPLAKEEIDFNIEIDESPTAIPQEFSVTEDLSAEPSKKQARERLTKSASPELSGMEELPEVQQEIIVAKPVGGMEDYSEYLSESLNYPEDARRDTIQGTVIVQCSISSDSLPTNCIIVQSLIKSCDEEAIRLIEEGPKWKLVSDSDQQEKIIVEVEFNLYE